MLLRTAISAALAKPGAPTKAGLCGAVDYSAANFSAWLAGRRPLPLVIAERMLEALDIEPDARRELARLRRRITAAERRASELLA
jgi:hypothetical protein